MSLCGYGITRTECAIGNNAWREPGDGSARTDSDVARNLTGAAIGHGRGAQDGEILS
jgi:hypothetical protein